MKFRNGTGRAALRIAEEYAFPTTFLLQYDALADPAKSCLYMPAQTKEGQIDVPVFRMLGSDPIYQYIAVQALQDNM